MTELKETISKNLKKYRIKAGLSQVALAEKMHIRSSSISNWENGQNSIDIDMLFKFCQIVGVSINDMVISEDNTTDPNYLDAIYALTPELKLLIETAKKMPQKEVKRLLDYYLYFNKAES